MRRLVCVVEGHGDAAAVPVLCHRVLREILERSDWYVDEQPVRTPRSQLVSRGAGVGEGLERAILLACARDPSAVLVLCDADDDCPAHWGPAVRSLVTRRRDLASARAVMASREFESWFLHGRTQVELDRQKITDPEQLPRDAKKALRRFEPSYSPSTDQQRLVRSLDLRRVWRRSDSFDKLVRSLAELTGSNVPRRPVRRS